VIANQKLFQGTCQAINLFETLVEFRTYKVNQLTPLLPSREHLLISKCPSCCAAAAHC